MIPAHADILEQPERLRGPFWASIAFHIALIALIAGLSWVQFGKRELWGDPNGGRFGSVAINAVASIPLPARSGAVNPVASDTESRVPEPPPTKAKPKPKMVEPDADAIPLRSRNATKRAAEPAAPLNKWRAQQQDRPNQLYSSVGQAAVSPMYQVAGGGGVGVGTNSPFGTQFGWYANAVRDQVARAWRTSDIDSRLQTAPVVAVTFTILRNGTLSGSVKVTQSSGNRALDISAQRAIYDSAPFPQLPPQFNRDRADVELRFELRR